jgi:hypothetical protein
MDPTITVRAMTSPAFAAAAVMTTREQLADGRMVAPHERAMAVRRGRGE